jgi:2-iminobutanoate/2-iminopropanoate deaminase
MTRARLTAAAVAGFLCAFVASAQSSTIAESASKSVVTDLPFSESVKVGNMLYLSGQIGAAPGTDTLVKGGIEGETRQAMNNIKAILKTSGYSMSNLVKCTAMLSDMSNWERFNAVYRSFFDGRFPARSTFGVTGLALGAQVEIECMATAAP